MIAIASDVVNVCVPLAPILINPKTDLTRPFLASSLGHLQERDAACRIWDELKDIRPEYSAEAHIGRLPFKDPTDAERFIEGLQKANLAE